MGFNLEKNYIERTAVYQFISDHPQVMLDVYDVVCKLCEQKNVPKERVIDLLNCAYKICTIATHPEGTLEDVNSIRHQYRIMPGFYSIAICIAYCLLTLHQEMDVWISKSILNYLKSNVYRYGLNGYFGTIPQKYAGNFNAPFNFSGKKVEQPQVASKELNPAEAFMRVQAEVAEAGHRLIKQNKELQEQFNDLEKKYEVECRFRRQAESIVLNRQKEWKELVEKEFSTRQKSESLQQQLQEMKAKYEAECRSRQEADELHQLELEGYRHRLFELQEQVDRLSDQQPNQESNQEPKREPEIPEVNRVFSLERFVNYALSLPTDEEAKGVVKLLREFCWYNDYVDPQAKSRIESILPQRQEAEAKKKARQQEAFRNASGQRANGPTNNYTFHIERVEQLNPNATDIHNRYERFDDANVR